jgi:hypothetical protein
MVIFHSYVSLPEGKICGHLGHTFWPIPIWGVSIKKTWYPNSWMVNFMENPSKKMDDGVPPFQETTKCGSDICFLWFVTIIEYP